MVHYISCEWGKLEYYCLWSTKARHPHPVIFYIRIPNHCKCSTFVIISSISPKEHSFSIFHLKRNWFEAVKGVLTWWKSVRPHSRCQLEGPPHPLSTFLELQEQKKEKCTGFVILQIVFVPHKLVFGVYAALLNVWKHILILLCFQR